MLLLLPCVIQKFFPFCTGSGRVPPILSGSSSPDKSTGERPLSHRDYTEAIAGPRYNDIQRNAQAPQKYPSSALLNFPLIYTFSVFFPAFSVMLLLSFYLVNEQKVRLQNTTCALLRSLYCNRTNFDFKGSKALRPRLTTGLPTIQFIPLWASPKRISMLCSFRIKSSFRNSRLSDKFRYLSLMIIS